MDFHDFSNSNYLSSQSRFNNEQLEQGDVFRLMVATVTDYAIFLVSPEGYILSWNPGAELLSGYQADEIIGKHYSIFYTPEDSDSRVPEQNLCFAIEKGRLVSEGWRLRKDGSKFLVNASITALRNEAGELLGFAQLVRDITEKKRAEKELKEAYVSMSDQHKEKSRALSARDQFLSIASHELKTPLTSLKLQSQFFIHSLNKYEGDIGPEKIWKFALVIDGQVLRLNRLVDDMLDISRIHSGKLILHTEEVDLCELIQETLQHLQPLFMESNIGRPSVEMCASAVGEFDKLRLEQVFNNLFTNAIKYGQGKPIFIQVQKQEDRVLITVQDQGIGLAEQDQHRIFDLFERAISANEVSGLGLGLFISKQIVLAHGGKIWVESQLGEGSCFYVDLPLSG